MVSPERKMLEAWRAQSRTLETIEGYTTKDVTLTGRGDAAMIHAANVQPTFPAFTGIGLLRGRTFLHEETLPGGPRVAIVGEQMWRERFGAAQDVIGQKITLDDKPFTVIGVAPAALRVPASFQLRTDVWLPLIADTANYGDLTVARIRAGVRPEAAARELDAIIERSGLQPKTGSAKYVVRLVRAGDMVGFKSSLFLLSGAVALLLLVACANVAHLLLARGATRERELAIRTALGAGRARLTRQLLTESLLLAAGGCVAGIAVGFAGVKVLSAFRPSSLAQLALTRVDDRALLVAVAIAVITGLAFGLTAALHAVRHTTSDSLRATGMSGTAAPRTHKLRSVLVVTEMALSALLLVGAALLVRSVINLENIDPGFDTRELFAMKIDLPRDRYPVSETRVEIIERVTAAARALPGVTSVSTGRATPPDIGGMMMAQLEADVAGGETAPNIMPFNTVAPDFFRMLGVRIDGPGFGPSSVERGDVVINKGLAKKLWPNQSAVGRKLRFPPAGEKNNGSDWHSVVGVVDNVPVHGLTTSRDEPILYYPIDKKSAPFTWTIAVRVTRGTDPVAALQRIVKTIDPRIVPPPVATVDAQLTQSISTQRFTMTLLGVFASLAVVLSAVGLYGVISYVVTQRTREIGIRIALGATPRHVARAIVARGLILSAIGIAAGLAIGSWGTVLIRSALYGVTGTDPISYAATAVLLVMISILACLIPMRRAMRVDPVIAMRGD
jgi:putative ABC transport system permease protein